MLLVFLEATWGLFAALAFFGISAFYWSRTAGKEPVETEIASRSRSALTNLFFRRWFYWALSPIENALIERKVSPDILNWVGLAFNAMAGIRLAEAKPGVAALWITVGGACDLLDGRIARKRGITSRRGAFLDSVLDRYADGVVYLGIFWLFAEDRTLSFLAVLAALGASLVSYTRARGESLGVTDSPGFAQRPERLLLLVFACMLTPLEAAVATILGLTSRYYLLSGVLFFLAVATHLAAIERFFHAMTELDSASGPPTAG